ncbi:MAG: hypothetical protein FJ215_08785 [Ignavibacteria bacterium]|nr:hypothetical protein [Ignavibacteria bacterium]
MVLLKTIIRPTIAFRYLRLNPTWVKAAAFILSLHSLLVILPALSREDITPPLTVMSMAVLMVNLWMVFKWISAAAILSLFVILVKQSNEGLSMYKKGLSVVIHSSIVQSLGVVVSAFLGIAFWLLGISTTFGFASFPSASTILPFIPIGSVPFLMLTRVNVFSIWNLFALTIGIATLFSFNRRKAFLSAFIVWLFLLTAQIAVQEFLKISIIRFAL